ncbi:hypothetical protein CQW23_24710 [Capsicum baccatum]|uniref:Uncharacterized protein n=1 Tax=Capsicum baccatum TaxID=33114 RepID=A0A2G2VVJ5_CAPBA|nr:hypothetical protein CQW23_24710 [Capsicum baccatum]
MAKQFNLVDARQLFQQVNVKKLPLLSLLQGKEVPIDDSGKLSNSWSDFFIGLRSSFVTLRHDNDLIVEPYSPYQFSRQFEFCQDVPGILKKHHFDGSLLALVQLWDSCVRLGSLSKLNIPMCLLDNGPFMIAASSSNESNASQEPNCKCLKKKHKDLSDQHREFADLDSISIETAIFEHGAAGSTLSLADLANQLSLLDVSNNKFGDDVFGEDCVTSPNPSSLLKSTNLSLDNAMTQTANKDSSTKLPKNIESFQNVPTTDMVAKANDDRSSNVPKDLVRPLQQIAPNFEP